MVYLPSSAPVRIAVVQEGDVDVVGRRCVQYLVDVFLSAVFTVPLGSVFVALPSNPDGSVRWPTVAVGFAVLWGLLALVLNLWYWVLRPASTGQTWGMDLVGIRVVKADGSPLTRGATLLRWLAFAVDGLFGGLLGLCMMLSNRNRRRVGDLVAGTLVVRS